MKGPTGIKFLTPHAPARPTDRPANRESNNGRNCWTCKHDAQELNRVICLNLASPRTEPASPTTGCPMWSPRDAAARIPCVSCNGERISKPKGDEDGE